MSEQDGGLPPDPPDDLLLDSPDQQDTNMQVTDSSISNSHENQNVSKPNLITEQSNTLKDGNSPQSQPERQKQVFNYGPNDQGPFHIYVEKKQINFSSSLNPLKVGDIILTNFPELDNNILSIDTIDIYVPKFIVVKQGVIRDISTEFFEDYLKNKIKSYEPHLPFEVLNVKRINRKNTTGESPEFVPTKSCIVSFKSQTLPKYVVINKVIKEVKLYKQKVLLCFNCLRYGHLGNQCRSRPRCYKCNKDHNSKEFTEVEKTKKCFSCMGEHFTIDLKDCPEFHRQKLIKETMSSANVNYHDANKLIPRNSYASITANRSTTAKNNPNESIAFQMISIRQPTRMELRPSCSTQPPPNFNFFGESSSHHSQTHNRVFNKKLTIEFHKPVKRLRPNSPDPIEITHREIISQPRTIGPNYSILTNPSYVKNVDSSDFSTHNSGLTSENLKIISELVANIIYTIKRTSNFIITKTELECIITETKRKDQGKVELETEHLILYSGFDGIERATGGLRENYGMSKTRIAMEEKRQTRFNFLQQNNRNEAEIDNKKESGKRDHCK
ncbi:unnamed protein product [Diabrotica balteata]|uniref:CCHC-type domain-containing protein n=1 Tax=Diabrotica balteata TaxID=107213 RepID=A0A9N9SMX3_DIABA|nr:unnamed protein product [Diabrotica balteata]